MRWLVVGAAGIPYLQALRAIGEQELALVEPDRIAGRAALPIVGKGFIYESWDDVRKTPDAVVVCSPPAQHLADMELATGAHIIVDTPVALTLDAMPAMLKTIKRERMGMVACPLRFHPGVQAIAALHQQGHFGDVYLVRVVTAHPLTRYAGWRGQKAQGGGLVYDHAGVLDVLRWAFAEPLTVRASTHGGFDGGPDIEAAAHVVVQYASALVTLELFVVQPEASYRLGMQFVGHKADRPPLTIPPEAADAVTVAEADAAGWDHARQREAMHWRNVIAGTEDAVQPLQSGFVLLETIAGIYASAAQGMGVRFQRPGQPASPDAPTS